MLSHLFLFITIVFLNRLILLEGLTCSNKIICVNGAVEIASKPFYRIVAPYYSVFRKSFNINVNVQYINATTSTTLRQGLLGTVTSPPIVFINTPHTIPQHDSDIEFPLFARAIVLIYNLPGVTNLNLTIRTISDIYFGRIQYWNHIGITQYNPNAQLPNEKIIPLARMDTDTSTAFITKMFSANDPSWNSTLGIFSSPKFVDGVCCNSTLWPPHVTYGNDTVGIIGIVNSYTYTIGYVVKEALSQYSMKVAALLKVNDNVTMVVSPTVENVDKAMYSYLNDSGPDDFQLNSDTIYSDLSAYELSAFSSIVLNYSYDDPLIDCCVVQELVGFIDWFYSNSNDDRISSLGFIPIINGLTERIKKLVLSRIQCHGELVYPLYLATITTADTSTVDIGRISLIVAVSFLVIMAVILSIVYYIYRKRTATDDNRWLIDPKRIKLIEVKQVNHDNRDTISEGKSGLSVDTSKIQNNTATTTTKHEDSIKFTLINGEMNDIRIYLNPLICKVPQQWSSETKKLMKNKFKNVLTRHVATLLGVTAIGQASHSVYEYCAKGTLHYVVHTSRYNLTDAIKYHFALDIANGLKYLHHFGIVHGFLSSLTCYVDSSWTVKVICWDQLSIYQKENVNQIKEQVTYSAESLVDKANFIKMLYVDPDVVTNAFTSVDVFSFGFILLEIFSRKLPYANDVDGLQETYSDILYKKFTRGYIVQPMFDPGTPTDIVNLVTACLAAKERRPNMLKIVEELKKYPRVAFIGIADIVMDILEKHADALENKVEERTVELRKVTQDMQNLLNEVLPPQIASQLLAGHAVLPEQFECVTVYFSDIVGFTTISAMSSPIEVMTFLNDLWIVFDNIIDKFDVYKVDTIGDAYMVCSGLPTRNGMNHCKEIALLSLALREKCSRFKIKHLPNHTLNVRIGINSGPVTAGVVGTKMPQYCVFGDTVNTAARMESTSLPQKIQLTERSYYLLHEHYPNTFTTLYRGEISVKGKGSMKTYWLLEHVSNK